MSALRQALTGYLRMRRGFGYRYNNEERQLSQFVAYLDAAQATVITRKLAMAWITEAQRTSWPQRLSAVRGFAQHLSNIEPGTETPPAGVFRSSKRGRPYIYTDVEIEQLLEATLAWGLADGINRWTYRCLFGLLAATGMRVGEAMALRRADVEIEVVIVGRYPAGGIHIYFPAHAAAAGATDRHCSAQRRRDHFTASAAAAADRLRMNCVGALPPGDNVRSRLEHQSGS